MILLCDLLMMVIKVSKTNCINCGAAKDTDEIKCPFCGTTYLDFTAIDFNSGDPVVCQFVMPGGIHKNDGRFILSMLAIPRLDEITTETDSVFATDGNGNKLAGFTTGLQMNIGVSFTPVCRSDKKETVILCYEKGDRDGDS